jgi:hypothetical protein
MVASPSPKAQAQLPQVEAAWHSALSRLAQRVLGRDGLLFASNVLRHLLKWLVYVFLAELGTAGTLLVLSMFGGQSSLVGSTLVGVHTAIVLIGLLGFLSSVFIEALLHGTEGVDLLMDRIELLVKRMIRIRRLWRRWKGAA